MQTAAAPLAAPARAQTVAVAGGAALAGALGASLWLVAAAAERPSLLSPPTPRAPHRRLLRPLSGLLPHLSTRPVRPHTRLTGPLAALFAALLPARLWAPPPAPA